MKKYSYRWLIVFVIHDFTDDADTDHTNRIINEEITGSGINEDHCLLLVHQQLLNFKSYAFKTTIKRLVPSRRSRDKFEFVELAKKDFDFHNKRSWEQMMAWINQKFPAKTVCLSTLSHGAGFGLFGKEPEKTDRVQFGSIGYIKKAYFRKKLSESSLGGSYTADGEYLIVKDRNNNNCCKTLQMLWVSELADAILSSFGRKKIDVLMLNNCYMQSFETGWVLRNRVKYLVAAEPRFTSFGYNYKGLLSRINDEPYISADNLIMTIKADFETKWSRNPGDFKRVGMSIADLSLYKNLKSFFDQIAALLLLLDKSQVKKIIKARQKKIRNVANTPTLPDDSDRVYLIDLNYFYDILKKLFPGNKKMLFAISQFKKFYTSALKDHYVGSDYTNHDRKSSDKFRLQGISVFLPLDLTTSRGNDIVNCAYFGRSTVDRLNGENIPLFRFVKHTQWDEFVKRYLDCL